MPKPTPQETQDEFMQRCVPEVIAEGNEQAQAVAICLSYWNKRNEE